MDGNSWFVLMLNRLISTRENGRGEIRIFTNSRSFIVVLIKSKFFSYASKRIHLPNIPSPLISEFRTLVLTISVN